MEKEKEFYWAGYLPALGYKSGRQNEKKVQQICHYIRESGRGRRLSRAHLHRNLSRNLCHRPLPLPLLLHLVPQE